MGGKVKAAGAPLLDLLPGQMAQPIPGVAHIPVVCPADIISDEEREGRKGINIFVNVSTGSKVSSFAGTMACMIWKGTPYYARIEYNDKKDPEDDLPDEDVVAIDEIPVYSINKPRPECLVILKLLSHIKGPQKMMKKNKLLQQLEEIGLVDKNQSSKSVSPPFSDYFSILNTRVLYSSC